MRSALWRPGLAAALPSFFSKSCLQRMRHCLPHPVQVYAAGSLSCHSWPCPLTGMYITISLSHILSFRVPPCCLLQLQKPKVVESSAFKQKGTPLDEPFRSSESHPGSFPLIVKLSRKSATPAQRSETPQSFTHQSWM